MNKKQEKIAEIVDQIHDEVKALFESEKYKKYLSCMAKFYNYSINNSILIMQQRPNATFVAGYHAWQNQFGRHVVQGAKGIQIIQPAPWKIKEEVELKDTAGNVIMIDGKPATEVVEKIVPGYKIGYVYAYEDTDGTPLPEIVSILDKKIFDGEKILEALKETSPVPVTYEKIDSPANGYFSPTLHDIHVQEGLSELQKIKTTIHEIAHAYLHDKEFGTDPEATRTEKEVSAESVAYAVCSYLGLDSSEYSFGYIAGWSANKSLQELQDKMSLIKNTAGTIIDKLDAYFTSLQITQDEELAYKNGEGYFLCYRHGNGYNFSMYDTSYHLLREEILDEENVLDAMDRGLKMLGVNSDYLIPYNAAFLKEQVVAISQEMQNASIVNLSMGDAMVEKSHGITMKK